MLALEPSMALASFSLSLLMQVHEAAAVVASGGEAGVEWDAGDGRRALGGEARGRLAAGRGGLLLCLPVKRATLTGVEVRHGERRPTRRHDGYSYPKAIYYLRTSTRAPHVSAAPVRCRKVVYPGGCTARPGSSHVLQSAAPTGPSS